MEVDNINEEVQSTFETVVHSSNLKSNFQVIHPNDLNFRRGNLTLNNRVQNDIQAVTQSSEISNTTEHSSISSSQFQNPYTLKIQIFRIENSESDIKTKTKIEIAEENPIETPKMNSILPE